MPRLPLVGGAYESRSVIANAQRCVNYYPEINRKDSPVPMTHYQRPGLVPMAAPAAPAAGRYIYQASNGAGYAAIGDKIYYVETDWTLTELGTITALLDTPVSMIDNGSGVVIVDGSTSQWQIDLLTNVMTPLTDATGNFAGATRVDTIDTFVIWNKPGTRVFGSTISNLLTTTGLSFAAKATYPDHLQTLIVRRTEIMLLGRLKGEIWYNIGGAIFPFARLPGSYIEYGCAAPYSVAAQDICVYWVSKSLEGQGIVLRLRGYEVTVISNPAIANAIQQMSDISDAVGYCYQQNGHFFYVIHFPTGDQTWVWDESIGDVHLGWHQEAWTDEDGILHRHRGNGFAMLNDTPCCLDWENGTIYKMDQNVYVDTVADVEYANSFIRSFPHVTQAFNEQGELVEADGKSILYKEFIADIECGNTVSGSIGLRWSDDGGRTWGQTVLQSAGSTGEYRTQPDWAGLGTAKRRVFEINHSLNGQAALNSAWIDAQVNAR